MKPFLKLTMVMLMIAGVLALANMGMGAETAVYATQLQGEAAREFLAREGILEQIAAESNGILAGEDDFVESYSVIAADGGSSHWFGQSVALEGDTAVIGAYRADAGDIARAGAAYVYIRSGTTWLLQQKLMASDAVSWDAFGWSVALSGDTIIVGADGADVDGAVDQGAAYIFTRSGTSWSQQQKLVASEGADGDRFGYAVALDGDTAIIMAPEATVNDRSSFGAAYVFVRNGDSWSQQQLLAPSGGNLLGSVALNGDTAIVGNLNGGGAHVFTRSGADWSEQQKLTANDGGLTGAYSIALEGDTAVIGSFRAAYLFTRSGETWSQQQKITSSDGTNNDWFGLSVALAGDTVIVGAPDADVGGNSQQGAAYVFTYNGETWNEQQKLVASNGGVSERFGGALALAGDTVVVGAAWATVGSNHIQGRAYFFERGYEPLEPTDFVYLPLVVRP